MAIESVSNGQGFNPSCLWKETSRKQTNKQYPNRAPGLVTTLRCWERVWEPCATERLHLALCSSPIWPLLSCIIYNQLVIIIKLALLFCEPFYQTIKPGGKGIMGTQIYSQVGQKCGFPGNPILTTAV